METGKMINELTQWGEQYVYPHLDEINKIIIENHFDDLKFSRIETSCNNSICSWLISTATKDEWAISEDDIADEVVVDITITHKNENIKLCSDVSLGNGQILFNGKTLIIPVNKFKNIVLKDVFEKYLNIFFKNCYPYIAKGINMIKQNNTLK